MSTNWNKHFYEQVINQGNYDPVDQLVLEELFRMLAYEVQETDEDGELSGDEALIEAYQKVLVEWLIPAHITLVNKIVEDMANELLQKMSPTQTEEGEG